jgi:hypothetical protein
MEVYVFFGDGEGVLEFLMILVFLKIEFSFIYLELGVRYRWKYSL